MTSGVKRYTHAKSVIMLVVSPESYEHDETHGLYVTAEDYAAAIAERDATVAERDRLAAAIRCHRDERADDRCWLDDYALYAELQEPIPDGACQVDEPCTMLKNCITYIESRHDPNKPYLSPQRTIEQLERDLAERDSKVEQLCKDLRLANVRVKSMGETCDGLRAEVERLMKCLAEYEASDAALGAAMDRMTAERDGLHVEVARLTKLYEGELDYSACLEAQKAEAVVLLRRWEGMVSSIIFLGEYELPLKDETAAYLYAHDGEPRQSGETA